jgi:NADH-quinone oxidoreductase subunit E
MSTTAATATVGEVVRRWGSDQSYLIEMLQDIQDEHRYLPHEVMGELSTELDVPLNRIYHLATFYKSFSLIPKGKHVCQVCLGTACHVQGAPRILSRLEEELGIKAGETDKERRFTLEQVRCVGCCGLAPVVIVDEDVIGHVKASQARRILRRYRDEAPAEEGVNEGS